MRRSDCHARIRNAERGYRTALRTVEAFLAIADAHPEYLYENDLTIADIRAMGKELHDVYFVRMFAGFESSLRDYWRREVRDTRPVTERLLASLAGRLGVPQDTLDSVNEVREYRNSLVHDDSEPAVSFTLEAAIGHLNVFLARLPLRR